MKRLLLLIFLPLLTGSLPAQAQDGSNAQVPNELGVREAIRLAHTQSPILNGLREQIRAKRGEWWSSFGLRAPELTYFREGVPTGESGFAEQRWTISQSIDFPLQSYYRLRRVDTEQSALRQELEAHRTKVTAAVKKAYTDLLYTQELVHLREQEVNLSEDLVEAVTVRVEAGEASELEQMKADIQFAEAESKLEEARRQFQNARYTLFNTIGLDPDEQRYSIVFPDTLTYIDTSIDQDRMLANLPHMPEMRGAHRRLKAAQFGVKQTRSALLPDLKIDFYPQDYGTGYDNYGFQFGISLPLWVIPTHRGSMRQARAQVQQQSWQREAVRLDLKKRAEQAWHSYATSKVIIQRYNDVVRARSEELLARTQEGYRIGEIDLLTLLDTQRTVLASEKRYYDALHDYYIQLIELERFLDKDIVFNPARSSPTPASDRP